MLLAGSAMPPLKGLQQQRQRRQRRQQPQRPLVETLRRSLQEFESNLLLQMKGQRAQMQKHRLMLRPRLHGFGGS